ncbi:uncharacterized protein [Arachis hypogaea]|uniref:uncharacterized protein isoform X7 n=1 Tax=Arachis hypogaea TaxID=3818 RepID=UPI003B2257DF
MKAMKMVYKQNKSKHRGVGVKELLKWRAIQQKEKIQIEGDFTDPEPDYEESKALDSTIGYVKGSEGTPFAGGHYYGKNQVSSRIPI